MALKKQMYDAINNSPQTSITSQIAADAQVIPVYSVDVFPPAPNLATIGTGNDAEVIRYNGISGNTLTGCERGFSGTTAKIWETESLIYRGFTKYDYDSFKENITELDSKKTDNNGDISNTVTSFTQSSTRNNIATGETTATIFGKISKWLADLKSVAFSGSYNDLENKPVSMTPTSHATSHAKDGADEITPESIEAQPKITSAGILKGDGTGNITPAEAGTDYADVATVNSIKNTANAALPKSGGTMTGELILAGNTTNSKGAVTKAMLDAISGGAKIKELTRFTSSGTFTKSSYPSTNDIYLFLMVGGGGGYESSPTSRNGSSGKIVTMIYKLTASTLKIVIGSGGTSGKDGGNTYIGDAFVAGQGASGGIAGGETGVPQNNITGYGTGGFYQYNQAGKAGICIVYGFQ